MRAEVLVFWLKDRKLFLLGAHLQGQVSNDERCILL